MKPILLILLLITAAVTTNGSDPYKGEKCIVRSEFIFDGKDVPFPSCHASTLIETGNGLLAAWFGGTEEKNPDVGIWISHFSGGEWSKPVEVANGIQHAAKRYPCWNPVLYKAGNEILLFYKVGPSPREWWGEMKSSSDNGKTWSQSNRLPEDITGPVKDKPVLLNNHELLCPSSSENDGWRVHMEFTSDKGLTWERTPDLNEKSTRVIQPTILIHKNNELQMLCRSSSLFIMTSFSTDYGRKWSNLEQTSLPNPNSGIDAVSLKDGRFLLVYNHLSKDRNILNVAISKDGLEWKAAALLENDPGDSEYSYPAVIQTSDGLVHITYTWNRKKIKHVVIDPDRIEARTILIGVWPEN